MYSQLLPNFIIGGAPKSGTSSVHRWIADHPDALGSVEKETYYFVDPGTHMYNPKCNILNGLSGYCDCFEPRREMSYEVVLESTPSYLYSESALRKLTNIESKPKFLFILRKPSDQIYSLFTYFKNNWDWVPSGMSFSAFLKAVDGRTMHFKGNELAVHAIDYCHYYKFLDSWEKVVGADRMMVLSFDSLLKDQKGFVKTVATWLGLDPSFYDDYEFPRDNETYVVRSSVLQKLNLLVRSNIPKGSGYEFLRKLYRKMNTSKSEGICESDSELKLELDKRFEESNAILSKKYLSDALKWNH